MFWTSGEYRIVLFYRYVHVEEPAALVAAIEASAASLGMIGRVLVAEEGINGTLAAGAAQMAAFVAFMEKDTRFGPHKVDWKYVPVCPCLCPCLRGCLCGGLRVCFSLTSFSPTLTAHLHSQVQ